MNSVLKGIVPGASSSQSHAVEPFPCERRRKPESAFPSPTPKPELEDSGHSSATDGELDEGDATIVVDVDRTVTDPGGSSATNSTAFLTDGEDDANSTAPSTDHGCPRDEVPPSYEDDDSIVSTHGHQYPRSDDKNASPVGNSPAASRSAPAWATDEAGLPLRADYEKKVEEYLKSNSGKASGSGDVVVATKKKSSRSFSR